MDSHQARRTINNTNPDDILVQSLRSRISELERENAKLQKSILSWKDAWWNYREIVGRMWWTWHKWKIHIFEKEAIEKVTWKLLYEAARDRDRYLAELNAMRKISQ